MKLTISRYQELWVTKLCAEFCEPVYVRTFSTREEVDAYIAQLKLDYPELVVE